MTIVVIGAGLAGLTTALSLAPQPVLLLSRDVLGQATSSNLAQGGIAAALDAADSPEKHAADTLAAGAGLCDPAVVESVTREGPAAIAQLLAWGTAFDRDDVGQMRLSLEGAHSCRRVAHVDGDGTGAGIMRALIARARETPSIHLREGAIALRLHLDAQGAIEGVTYRQAGRLFYQKASQIVLATGGAGALWPHTTAPNDSWGHGIALAAKIGARLRDLAFMQFHPTALDTQDDPMPLVSEAVRGEGARLVDETGRHIIENDLAPRDVVARAIWAEMQKGHRVFLDARAIASFETHFPAIFAYCAVAGVDPARAPIPIRPVAHYHMGGVWVDEDGGTSIPGLWAVGEVSSTGLHGANRLASNSLLEAVVYGRRVAAILAGKAVDPAASEDLGAAPLEADDKRSQLRAIMGQHVGVLRDEAGLGQAVEAFLPHVPQNDQALVAFLIAREAKERRESRGAHTRTDYPDLLDHAASSLTDPLALWRALDLSFDSDK